MGILICFPFLAIMNNAAMDICVQIFMWTTPSMFSMPVFWSLDVNRWLIGKVPDAGKGWRQKEKRVSEDEMAGWHHWCNGHELGQTSGDGEGSGGLACCSPWVTELNTTGPLNKNEQHAFNTLGSVYFSMLFKWVTRDCFSGTHNHILIKCLYLFWWLFVDFVFSNNKHSKRRKLSGYHLHVLCSLTFISQSSPGKSQRFIFASY